MEITILSFMLDVQSAPFYFFTPILSNCQGNNILPDEIFVREKILAWVRSQVSYSILKRLGG